MKLLLRLILIFLCLNCFIIQGNGMSLPIRMIYVDIDSISKKDIHQSIDLSLREDSIKGYLNKRTYIFKQQPSNEYTLFSELNDSIKVELLVDRLLLFTSDSVYISVKYRYSNTGIYNYISDTASFARNDLRGISYTYIKRTPQKIKSLYGGYVGNLKDTDREKEKYNRNYHGLEIGASYWKAYPTFWSYNLYAANEFLFNSYDFFIGPKIGANINLIIVMAGNELVYYTDLKKAMLAYRPYVAFGIGPFKCSIGYNFTMFNKEYFKMNRATVELTIPFWLKD